MAKATRTEIFQAPIDRVYSVILDYRSYPEFVDGVSTVNVLDESDSGARVEYGLNLIKKFKYILKLTHKAPESISWEFESGDIFKVNNGSWQLRDMGDGTTEVTYSLEIEVKGFVPKAIVNGLTQKNLPAMMSSYHQRAKVQ